MAWLIMSLRRSELTRNYNQHVFEKMQISRQMRKLSSFSNAIADGNISPSEIAGLGTDLFGDALDFMGYANEAADAIANDQVGYYATAFDTLTQEQYYNNPSIAAQAQLYYDENGSLDTERMYSQFYQQALKEFAQKYMEPLLKEKEEELEDKKNELDTLAESEKAELDQLSGAISSEIQSNTIKLS